MESLTSGQLCPEGKLRAESHSSFAFGVGKHPRLGQAALFAWAGSQGFDVNRFCHSLETRSVWMQEIARTADRHVRLEWGFHGSGRGIQGGRIKIRHGIKETCRSDKIVNLFSFRIYFGKPIARYGTSETRYNRRAYYFNLFGMQSLDRFLEALDHLVSRNETCAQIINSF
jgi:hypothetical protein